MTFRLVNVFANSTNSLQASSGSLLHTLIASSSGFTNLRQTSWKNDSSNYKVFQEIQDFHKESLAIEGIKANRAYLDNVDSTRQQIEQLKRKV